MSRCFPFPPPGYERQARSDHVDLLAKEKQKEKKRTKEKKDKEKREGKDKKEKDRSKDKHKDKKDRKEKDKDKKKEKEREKDKNPSEGVRADKLNDSNHYELGECSQKAKEANHSKFTEDLDRRIKDEQKVAASRMVENFNVPLYRNIGHNASPSPTVDRVAGSRVIQSSMVDPQKRDFRVEKPANNPLNSAQRTDVLGFSNAMQKEKNTSKKVAPKLDQKGDSLSFANAMQKEKNTSQVTPKLEQKGDILGLDNVVQRDHFAGQRLAPKIEQKGAIGTEAALRNPKVSIRKPEGFTSTASLEKENKSKKSDVNHDSFVKRTINGMSQPRNGMSQPRNGMSQPPEALSNQPHENTSLVHHSTKIEKKVDTEKNHDLVGQRDIDGIDRLMDKGGQRLASETDKTEDQCRKEEKQKDRDHKKHKSKHKHKDKEKVKDKATEKSERKKKEHDGLRDKVKEDQTDGLKLKHLAAQVDDAKSQLPNGITKKRKEVEANGFLHENDPRPNKFLKTPPSHHPVENGSRFPVSPVTTNCLSIKPEATNNAIAGKLPIESKNNAIAGKLPIESKNNAIAGKLPIESKNHVTNGISKVPPLSAHLRHPDTTDISAANGVPLKPHPDDKYLSQIYSVPKMEEWLEYDDQEWLFSSNQTEQKRQLTRDAVELPQVWAEALRIESDDVVAMPYVIPF